ncbi:CDGSH iron-sulfur domain-containing protein [Beggiatoa alba]|nr:CDGSH iron-sulfur domain-containing protein [Beggiatoa alba]
MYTRGEPYVETLKKGESIYICQCGQTQTPPYCDASHQQSPGKQPLTHTAVADGSVYVCGCGKTANKPWCDGSHNT